MLLLTLLILLNISCSKDSDLLLDAVANERISSIVEKKKEDNEPKNENFTIKTVAFSALNDAYLQKSKGYNQSIVRLDENHRTSYLMFDISPVKDTITEITLQFTVSSDSGNGNIDVSKGLTNDWTEKNLTLNNAPSADVVLGSVNKSYKVGEIQEIPLNIENIVAQKLSLVLTHSAGNDLAFASKEHSKDKGPRLIISYKAPIGSEDIVIPTTPEEPEEPKKPETPKENTTNSNVEYWKKMFNDAWNKEYSHAVAQSESKNRNQEYYHLAYPLDGLIQIWQATGDNNYLDLALDLIENTIDDAKPMSGDNSGYLGWSANSSISAVFAEEGVPLWESYMYKHVATLLRIMHQSPNLRATKTYQLRYEIILDFVKIHIWEKWYQSDDNSTVLSNIYRNRTHMASHWARIGMELYIITGKTEYKDVFENISFKGMEAWGTKSLRSRIYNIGNAYSWNQEWSKSTTQDTSHGSDMISFWVTAYENDMYWDINDMNALIFTLDNHIWSSNSPLKFTANVDGSGGSSAADAAFHSYLSLGRFNEALQQRIRNYCNTSTVKQNTAEAMAIAALNRRILDDGAPIYPENY
ncbi:MAG: DNRLRE domain-containing protein [Cellulophaga sp.]